MTAHEENGAIEWKFQGEIYIYVQNQIDAASNQYPYFSIKIGRVYLFKAVFGGICAQCPDNQERNGADSVLAA
ncbi:hypothetical protein OfM1_09540 [Lactovum odontotermitis]